MFLATQAMDEARHTEVFRKRALAQRRRAHAGEQGRAGAHCSIFVIATRTRSRRRSSIFSARASSSRSSAPASSSGNNDVDKRVFRLCMQDEARHVSYGTMHIRQFLEECPDREDELHEALDEFEPYLAAILLSPDIVESMAILFAGGVKDADKGLAAVRLLWGRALEEYFGRCDRAGLDRRSRCNAAGGGAVLNQDFRLRTA